jgi:hypothetical protein
MPDLTYIDVVNFGIALLGATLGVLATWNQFRKDQVRLRVVPKRSYQLPGGAVLSGDREHDIQKRLVISGATVRWAVEVINLSSFPISVSAVGFGTRGKNGRHIIVQPEVSDGRSWPVRLESREAVVFFAQVGEPLPSSVRKHPYAFVETDCGEVRWGSSPILRSEADRIQESQK